MNILQAPQQFSYEIAYSETFGHYPKVLEKAVTLVEAIPQVQVLLAKIKLEGGIGIETSTDLLNGDQAAWHSVNRVILFNSSHIENDSLTLAEKIQILTFETCNASRTKIFQFLIEQATRGGSNINKYVEDVEKMEHQTALQNDRILKEGADLGLFPNEGFGKPTSENFHEYYALQQICGHSQRIASRYQTLFPNTPLTYSGTVCHLNASCLRKLYAIIGLNNSFMPADETWAFNLKRTIDIFYAMRFSRESDDRQILEAVKKIFNGTQGLVGSAFQRLN